MLIVILFRLFCLWSFWYRYRSFRLRLLSRFLCRLVALLVFCYHSKVNQNQNTNGGFSSETVTVLGDWSLSLHTIVGRTTTGARSSVFSITKRFKIIIVMIIVYIIAVIGKFLEFYGRIQQRSFGFCPDLCCREIKPDDRAIKRTRCSLVTFSNGRGKLMAAHGNGSRSILS